MKISKIFHWLYFTVMMLPCVIIPIFAIYTRNENYNSNIELQVQENLKVDFNQYYNSSTSTPRIGITRNDNTYTIGTSSVNTWYVTNAYSMVTNHKYYIAMYYDVKTNGNTGFNYTLAMQLNGQLRYIQNSVTTDKSGSFKDIITKNSTHNNNEIGFYLWMSSTNNYLENSVFSDLQYIDLTQAFGEGNEPSIEEFNTYFPNGYYPYTESQEYVIENYETITYNDTDVGSQFVYTLYNATDTYFNFDNFFGLDNVYSWIQLNWFSGNAPLGFAIFWHFFTYWLLASLAWLLFDLMVYVPLYIHRWLDKGAIE